MVFELWLGSEILAMGLNDFSPSGHMFSLEDLICKSIRNGLLARELI